ncbi:thiol reductant ABC exporter subunit CydD [Kaistia geumhonensis]|uniref:ATP-binding cassette subfamily C protein CydD n=1 Tax=Kaistia geumhonensis TaxID=410839 RepID=A0ABU0M2E5_9HYPH|nr:thiol reductant ABC exporter subunit CydD [Kaistia geumhonensis]MCX5479658.1 thiol reductant ABC exporter subunit CydD [Kaistia geumhonensis]MDQ0515118.1 ATP-binding cassette subfamily C protein CydD [Kaistia geumhonensis]
MSTIEHNPTRPSPLAGAESGAWLKAQKRAGGAWLRIAIAVPLVAGVFTVAQAYVLAVLIDRALAGNVPRAEQAGLAALLVAIVAARALLAYVGERAGARASEDAKHAIRGALQASLVRRSPEWFRDKSSGVIAAQLVDSVEALDGYFARFMPAMIAAAILPLAFAIGLMPIDLVIGVLFFVTAPLIPAFMALVGWGAEAASRRHLTAFTRLSGLFADRLRGIVVLKLFGRAEDEVARVRAASDDVAARTLGVLRIAFLSSAVLEFFAAIGVAGVALYVGLTYLGYIDLRGAPLSLQAGLFCLLMAPDVYMPLRTLAAHYHDRAAAKAAVADIASVIGLPGTDADIAPARSGQALPQGPLAVTLAGVGVDAPGRGTVLREVTLDIPPGTSVALLGPSGIGKSTLVEAIARLRAAEGGIAIGGVPLPEIGEEELRSRVVLIPQRPRLFHGSIADNIRLARRGADEAAVEAAARAALVMEFADRGEGLATPVGERGRGISGGEAHRVALARLFLTDPGLVLLDEPTAHLDADTEARIVDAILAFSEGRTLIVATHSQAVARRMDRIYRIAGGRLLPVPHRPAAAREKLREQGERT